MRPVVWKFPATRQGKTNSRSKSHGYKKVLNDFVAMGELASIHEPNSGVYNDVDA
jgi:hypothetical protein